MLRLSHTKILPELLFCFSYSREEELDVSFSPLLLHTSGAHSNGAYLKLLLACSLPKVILSTALLTSVQSVC